MEEEIRLTNDLVFQRIFGKVGNENITKAFLEKSIRNRNRKLNIRYK